MARSSTAKREKLGLTETQGSFEPPTALCSWPRLGRLLVASGDMRATDQSVNLATLRPLLSHRWLQTR